jgi:hypothetical protein
MAALAPRSFFGWTVSAKTFNIVFFFRTQRLLGLRGGCFSVVSGTKGEFRDQGDNVKK